MVRRVYARLGTIRYRSEVVEYRVEQQLERLGDRLEDLGWWGLLLRPAPTLVTQARLLPNVTAQAPPGRSRCPGRRSPALDLERSNFPILDAASCQGSQTPKGRL